MEIDQLLFYVTKINRTFDYMNLITVFLPSTGDACNSELVWTVPQMEL